MNDSNFCDYLYGINESKVEVEIWSLNLWCFIVIILGFYTILVLETFCAKLIKLSMCTINRGPINNSGNILILKINEFGKYLAYLEFYWRYVPTAIDKE